MSIDHEVQIDYEGIGKRIKHARKEKGLTQDMLAQMVGLSLPYVSNIENAHSKVALPTLIRIAQELHTSVDYLLYDNTPILIETYDQDAHEILKDCTEKERLFLLAEMLCTKKNLRNNKMK